jgi:hypothetical protein
MKPILFAGTSIVNLALISYSFFIFYERKYKVISSKVLSFLTIGVIFDIIATICMIIGSSKGPFTLHGLIGYSSLTGMLIDLVIIWRQYIRNGNSSIVSAVSHKYSLFAYLWWIAAYVSGIVLVMLR